jgi:DNA-binding response OmpR family regulator
MSQGRILIVEDDPEISNMLRIDFQAHGYEVAVVQFGEDVLEICQRQVPDIVLLEVWLADMNGLDVLRRLRAHRRTEHIVAILLAREKPDRGDKLRGLELGADDYITRPLDLQELALRVRNKLRDPYRHPTSEQSRVPGRMMIVEDDPDISNMLRIYFQSQGYGVAVAQRGEDALEMCLPALPHVVILDIMLPDMDGYDVCRELRGDLLTTHIPIIFLTQKDTRDDKIHGLELGADDYITKPFDLEELKLKVQNTLQRTVLDPVTGLPRSGLVEDQLASLFFRPPDWALLYFSINNLDAFNAVYGPVASEEVLRFTAMNLVQAMDANATPFNFIGHVGSNDFIIVTEKDLAEPLVKDITRRFDAKVELYYDWQARERGHLLVRDDEGNETKVDLMSLSIGVATADDGPFADIREIIEAAAKARRTSRFSHPLHPNTEVNSPRV